MDLIIDIGNTRGKAGVFNGDQLVDVLTFEGQDTESVDALLNKWPVSRLGVSSVADWADQWIRNLGEQMSFVLLIDRQTPVPIGNAYATPETLGSDRLAAATGAWSEFSGRHCLIVDAGTCLTADVVDDRGVFLGGNISPGIDMRLRAMYSFTARLPLAEKCATDALIGRSTDEALRNGALQGAQFEVSALCGALRKIWPALIVVLTGGDANYFVNLTESETFVRPHLVLTGLKKIVSYNAEQSH